MQTGGIIIAGLGIICLIVATITIISYGKLSEKQKAYSYGALGFVIAGFSGIMLLIFGLVMIFPNLMSSFK